MQPPRASTRPSFPHQFRLATARAAFFGSLSASFLAHAAVSAAAPAVPLEPRDEVPIGTSPASEPDAAAPGETAPAADAEVSVEAQEAEPASDEDALAFDQVSIAEIDAMSRRTFEGTQEPPEPFMKPGGVNDPFPDRRRRTRVHHIVVPAMVSLGLVAGGASMAHLALNPNCETAGDITSCSVPNGADIGVRGGRALAAVGFGLGGGVFGALGGRELGARLQQAPGRKLEQQRRVAVGVGTTSVVLGAAGLVTGGVLLGQGIRGARDVGSEVAETETAAEALPFGDPALRHITQSRAGFMLLVSTPTLVAFGASLLVHRPKRRVRLSPKVSRSFAGVTLSGQF